MGDIALMGEPSLWEGPSKALSTDNLTLTEICRITVPPAAGVLLIEGEGVVRANATGTTADITVGICPASIPLTLGQVASMMLVDVQFTDVVSVGGSPGYSGRPFRLTAMPRPGQQFPAGDYILGAVSQGNPSGTAANAVASILEPWKLWWHR